MSKDLSYKNIYLTSIYASAASLARFKSNLAEGAEAQLQATARHDIFGTIVPPDGTVPVGVVYLEDLDVAVMPTRFVQSTPCGSPRSLSL